jgi:succinate dehydrogenase / fumarate reductase cytochrome b subunit
MLASGMLVLAYVVYHLAHFTFRVTNPEISHLTDAHGHHDVYSMVVLSFRQPFITVSYTVAMLLLGMHLNHGVSSFFQTLGITSPRYAPIIRTIGPALALVIVVGYISIPVAILLGWVQPTQAAA